MHAFRIRVPASAIDAVGHVNNREYIAWMQDAATSHSAAAGWPEQRYFETGATWIVRSHFVEYLRPAFDGDELTVHTWVHAMGAIGSPRRYLFLRDADGERVARAETVWVFIDVATGRPRRIPAEIRDAFPIVDDAAVAAALGAGYEE
ncbi:MAG: acyl-CoA thioesterase [Gemmatimonadetes bacterium]|nr:acyl-CoA thioesterase [Gemmatimonadota bacterium]NIQ55812.1 acyl-CoA thioesterase [Gemmatimonadota bacterium]NIU76018.1 acyl-CoA thioesterase [Gammaproteobacteria bacterium]NIX45590.1 acyl-CoA thioesterase [Gemmatimonadota bacterium]NIY09879.1 acyl-CoA thioesterase [Gemmatimonadota bacterium]